MSTGGLPQLNTCIPVRARGGVGFAPAPRLTACEGPFSYGEGPFSHHEAGCGSTALPARSATSCPYPPCRRRGCWCRRAAGWGSWGSDRLCSMQLSPPASDPVTDATWWRWACANGWPRASVNRDAAHGATGARSQKSPDRVTSAPAVGGAAPLALHGHCGRVRRPCDRHREPVAAARRCQPSLLRACGSAVTCSAVQ